MKTSITHVAMDTHKKQHQVAWVHPDTGEIQEFTVPNTPREIERMVKKIRKQTPGEIHVCCDAGAGRLRVGDASAIAAVVVESCPEIENGFTESQAGGQETQDRVYRVTGYRRGLA